MQRPPPPRSPVVRTQGPTNVYDTGEVKVYALAAVDLELFALTDRGLTRFRRDHVGFVFQF